MKYFVYAVIEKRTQKVKIGYCRSDRWPNAVIHDLQLGNPNELCPGDVLIECDNKPDAKDAEKCVHDALTSKGLRIRGEWFKRKALDLPDDIFDDCAKQ